MVPILGWLPHYNTETALGDLIAGITVGLTLIPQSIAYAALAGLEPQVRFLIQAFSNIFFFSLK